MRNSFCTDETSIFLFMKHSLQGILSTKSVYDFPSRKFHHSQEEVPTHFLRLKPSKLEVASAPGKPRRVLFDWTCINPSDRPVIFLNDLLKDREEDPRLGGTNYSCWSTSHKHKREINYTPPIKKNLLLIKPPDNASPAVGYYEPKMKLKVRGQVRLHQSQQISRKESLEPANESVSKEEVAQNTNPANQRISEKKLIRFLDQECHKLKNKLSFQLNPRRLDEHPFGKSVEQFNFFKNRIKILKDLRYIE